MQPPYDYDRATAHYNDIHLDTMISKDMLSCINRASNNSNKEEVLNNINTKLVDRFIKESPDAYCSKVKGDRIKYDNCVEQFMQILTTQVIKKEFHTLRDNSLEKK